MAPVDHVREAETLLAAAAEAQPTEEAALLVARAQVHATLATAIATAAATAMRHDENGVSRRHPHSGGDSRDSPKLSTAGRRDDDEPEAAVSPPM
jgi:hypothetical protein